MTTVMPLPFSAGPRQRKGAAGLCRFRVQEGEQREGRGGGAAGGGKEGSFL